MQNTTRAYTFRAMSRPTTIRLHWCGAAALAIPLALVAQQALDADATWVIAAVMFLVFLMSEVAQSGILNRAVCWMGLKPPQRSALTHLVDEYCKQRYSRRCQRPWLVVSLIAAVATYILWSYRDLLPRTTSLAWLPLCISALATLVSMAIAGAVAETDPPRDGIEDILQFLATYEPKRPERVAWLKDLIAAGEWKLSDLVSVATAEEQARKRESRRSQNATEV